ncbi:MAG: HAD family hydrolase [Candidatus Diapherotrites archaeon]|uniref:HAD family hydrolase n=1 Tax=Candidatus Iainarchaeum sp. TaxID=3101447 RepID=A0A938YMU6_9ARCH|nr:HAD family hydrolase [Candidatus Diapherotrites archaeon]
MIKLVVFDWNGTILSDTIACVLADNKVLSKLGLGKLTVKKYQETFDVPVLKFFEANGLKPELFWKNIDLIYETFHSNYEEKAKNCRTRAGTRELLEWLQKNKIKAVILSNHTVENIEEHLKRLKINEFFQKVLANDSKKTALQNKKKWLQNFLRETHFKKSEVLVVGDGPEEIEIAKKLGAKSVALSQGAFSTKRLRKARPDFLVHNLKEVSRIIRGLNKR